MRALLLINSRWEFHESLESSVMPRYRMVVTRGTVKRETFVEVPLAFSCEHNGLGFKDAEFTPFVEHHLSMMLSMQTPN